FHDRYRGDALVLDKWFALQATVPAPETLDHVRSLQKHPAFSPTNPNRIRALVGAYASGNQTQFNRADGAGYEFLADYVLDLDKRNPQTAARLLVSFRSWRALEEGRRKHAEHALRRGAAAETLSTGTRGIVTRTQASRIGWANCRVGKADSFAHPFRAACASRMPAVRPSILPSQHY